MHLHHLNYIPTTHNFHHAKNVMFGLSFEKVIFIIFINMGTSLVPVKKKITKAQLENVVIIVCLGDYNSYERLVDETFWS